MFEELENSLSFGKRTGKLYEVVFQRWVEVDPEAAFSSYLRIPRRRFTDTQRHYDALRGIAIGAGRSEISARECMALAKSRFDTTDRRELEDALFQSLDAGTPQATVDLARQLYEDSTETQDRSRWRELHQHIADTWFHRDSKAAWAYVKAQSSADNQRVITQKTDELLGHLAAWNFDAAITLAETENVPSSELTPLMKRWIEQKPESAAAWIQSNTSGEERDEFVAEWIVSGRSIDVLISTFDEEALPRGGLGRALSAWAFAAPERFKGWLDLKSDAEAERFFRTAVEDGKTRLHGDDWIMLGASPDALGYYLDRFGSSSDVDLVSKAVGDIEANTFSRQLDELQRVATDFAEGPVRTAIEDAVALKKLRTNPRALFDLIEREAFPDDPDARQEALTQAVVGATMESTDDVWEYAKQIPESLQGEFFLQVLRLTSRDEITTSELANVLGHLAETTSPRVAETIGNEVARRLANHAAWQQAAEWALATGSEQAASAALKRSMDRWGDTSPSEAVEWLDSAVIPRELRDIAVASLVPKIIDDPNAALKWAATISDSEQRLSVTSDVVNKWRLLDPVRTQEALATAGLTAAESITVAEQSGLAPKQIGPGGEQ